MQWGKNYLPKITQCPLHNGRARSGSSAFVLCWAFSSFLLLVIWLTGSLTNEVLLGYGVYFCYCFFFTQGAIIEHVDFKDCKKIVSTTRQVIFSHYWKSLQDFYFWSEVIIYCHHSPWFGSHLGLHEIAPFRWNYIGSALEKYIIHYLSQSSACTKQNPPKHAGVGTRSSESKISLYTSAPIEPQRSNILVLFWT